MTTHKRPLKYKPPRRRVDQGRDGQTNKWNLNRLICDQNLEGNSKVSIIQ